MIRQTKSGQKHCETPKIIDKNTHTQISEKILKKNHYETLGQTLIFDKFQGYLFGSPDNSL